MPRFDPTDFSRLLARLTPQGLRKVEVMVAEARERAEAVLEIDVHSEADEPAASCPRCGGDKRIRCVSLADPCSALAGSASVHRIAARPRSVAL